MPLHPDTPAAGKGKTGDNIDQCRLSRSVGAKQSEEFASMDFEINAVQGMQCTETLMHLPDFDCRSHEESSVSNEGMTIACRSAIWTTPTLYCLHERTQFIEQQFPPWRQASFEASPGNE